MTIDFTAGTDFGEKRSRNVKCFEKISAPLQRFEIHELRSAGVGNIGDMNAAVYATGEIPNEGAVGVAKSKVARLGEFTGGAKNGRLSTFFGACGVSGERKTRFVLETVLAPV